MGLLCFNPFFLDASLLSPLYNPPTVSLSLSSPHSLQTFSVSKHWTFSSVLIKGHCNRHDVSFDFFHSSVFIYLIISKYCGFSPWPLVLDKNSIAEPKPCPLLAVHLTFLQLVGLSHLFFLYFTHLLLKYHLRLHLPKLLNSRMTFISPLCRTWAYFSLVKKIVVGFFFLPSGKASAFGDGI